jgi:hypothetical protein
VKRARGGVEVDPEVGKKEAHVGYTPLFTISLYLISFTSFSPSSIYDYDYASLVVS